MPYVTYVISEIIKLFKIFLRYRSLVCGLPIEKSQYPSPVSVSGIPETDTDTVSGLRETDTGNFHP